MIVALCLAPISSLATSSEVCGARDSSLSYILDTQAKSDGSVYQRGEWASRVHLGGPGRTLGILAKGDLDDRNAFTTASIHNILAEIYLRYDSSPRLLGPIAQASSVLPLYMTDSGGYNFWPRIPEKPGDFHAPRFAITSSTFAGFLSIPADADDTAVIQYAEYIDNLICQKKPAPRHAGLPEHGSQY